MDKVKAVLTNYVSYILMVVIAILSLLTGMSDTGESLQIALDKDKAIAQAAEIIKQTPEEEVDRAVTAEDVSLEVE